MSKTAQIRARTEPQLKEKAEAVLEELGLTPSAAINMFYSQIVHHHGIPFPVALPNETTREAIRDARESQDLMTADSLDGLLERLDDEG